MNFRRLFFSGFVFSCCLCAGSLHAQLFFSESFDYADGDLDTVSGGVWTTHNGDPPSVQVVGGQAVISSPGLADHNRLTGIVAGVNDVWYYAVRFSVELGVGDAINNDYFAHFKDDSTFGFNARLAPSAPADPANDFSLQIWASSGGDGMVDWDGDFSFGEELVCVVRWNNGTGEATLWVNPVDESSVSVTDDEVADAMRPVESVAFRQDGGDGMNGSSVVSVDALAAGTDFATVLSEVQPMGFLLGDVNCDGVVDLLDVGPFVDLLTIGGFDAKADIDMNGVVELLDVAPFVALLSGN